MELQKRINENIKLQYSFIKNFLNKNPFNLLR